MRPARRTLPPGLLAAQNGEAADPENTDDTNGCECDGSTQFRFVDWAPVAEALTLK